MHSKPINIADLNLPNVGWYWFRKSPSDPWTPMKLIRKHKELYLTRGTTETPILHIAKNHKQSQLCGPLTPPSH